MERVIFPRTIERVAKTDPYDFIRVAAADRLINRQLVKQFARSDLLFTCVRG
jgi:hypothetical protein